MTTYWFWMKNETFIHKENELVNAAVTWKHLAQYVECIRHFQYTSRIFNFCFLIGSPLRRAYEFVKLYRPYCRHSGLTSPRSKCGGFKVHLALTNNYIILDGIEGCMRIYCTRHDDIHRAGTARWISSWLVQYILIQSEIKPSNIIIII